MCLLLFFFSLPLFVKAANFLSVLAPFSLLHCFSISCSALYEQIVGRESSIFSLWCTEPSIAFLILLCLLCVCPNYRQVTAETSLCKETGGFSGIDPKTRGFYCFDFIPAGNPGLIFCLGGVLAYRCYSRVARIRACVCFAMACSCRRT